MAVKRTGGGRLTRLRKRLAQGADPQGDLLALLETLAPGGQGG
jgi:hypothetical protein